MKMYTSCGIVRRATCPKCGRKRVNLYKDKGLRGWFRGWECYRCSGRKSHERECRKCAFRQASRKNGHLYICTRSTPPTVLHDEAG